MILSGKTTLIPACSVAICLHCGMMESDEKHPATNPPDVLPDTSQPVILPDGRPEPVLTVGDGSAAGCTAERLHQMVDSLSKMKRGGTIRFSSGNQPVMITLTSSLHIISPDSPLVIDGENLVTLAGDGSSRLIECAHYARMVLLNLHLTNGVADSSGAGILHPWYGSLACYSVTFSENRCRVRGPEFGGGAVFAGGLEDALFFRCSFINNQGSNGGALLNRGTNLIIDSCVFNGNRAIGDGGGKDAGDGGQGGLGGAVYIDGMNYDTAQPFILTRSTFTGNVSHCHGSAVFSYYYKDKPGISGATITQCGFHDNRDSGSVTSTGTLYHEGAPLKLHASTFAGNRTLKHAGAIFLGGNSTTEMINCTFYDNRTPGNGGAIFGGKQNISIVNCTFCGNEGSYGPAIFNDVPEAVTIRNTIFAGNIPITNRYACRNCTATYTNGAHVFQWPSEKANGKPDNVCIADAVFADPLLDTLAFNGGKTMTLALGEGSPAIGVCDSCPETDQRGFPRKERCDAGAYER